MAKFGIERNNYIGGSDFSSVLELNPYKKYIELVLEKAGVLANTFEGNEYTKRGERLEDTIIELFEKETGLKVIDKQKVFEKQPDDCMKLLCHVDGVIDNSCIFEAKTTDIKGSVWDNGIPAYYKAQLEFNMFLADFDTSYIAVGFCKDDEIVDFKYFEYKRQLADSEIITKCQIFTQDVEHYKSLGILNSGKINKTEIDGKLIDEYETLNYEITKIKAQLNPLEKKKKLIEEKLKAKIGNDYGIMNDMYKITLGNRITSPTSEYKVSRSGLKIEYI